MHSSTKTIIQLDFSQRSVKVPQNIKSVSSVVEPATGHQNAKRPLTCAIIVTNLAMSPRTVQKRERMVIIGAQRIVLSYSW